MPATKHIIIIGAMGTGKTSTGTRLAQKTGRLFLDSDSVILRSHGRSSGQIAKTEGVAQLHNLEASVFLDALDQPPAIISPAASILDNPQCVGALKQHLTFALEAPLGKLFDRLSAGKHRRTITLEALRELVDRRAEATSEVALETFDTTQLNPDAVTARILQVSGV